MESVNVPYLEVPCSQEGNGGHTKKQIWITCWRLGVEVEMVLTLSWVFSALAANMWSVSQCIWRVVNCAPLLKQWFALGERLLFPKIWRCQEGSPTLLITSLLGSGSSVGWIGRGFWILTYLHIHNEISWELAPSLNTSFIYAFVWEVLLCVCGFYWLMNNKQSASLNSTS